jgi:AcrR family transcriptional regulator
MAGRPRDEALRAAQRERILAAAEQLMVSHGVERSRLRDVAAAAGVSVGTVQHYFESRDRLIADLFDWSAERRLRSWTDAVPAAGDPWSRMVALLSASLPEPALWRSRIWIEFCAMARDDALRAKLDRFYDAWRPPFRESIEAGTAAGVFHPLLPVDEIVNLFIIVGDGAAVGIALGAPGIDADGIRALLVDTARTLLRPGHRAADEAPPPSSTRWRVAQTPSPPVPGARAR